MTTIVIHDGLSDHESEILELRGNIQAYRRELADFTNHVAAARDFSTLVGQWLVYADQRFVGSHVDRMEALKLTPKNCYSVLHEPIGLSALANQKDSVVPTLNLPTSIHKTATAPQLSPPASNTKDAKDIKTINPTAPPASPLAAVDSADIRVVYVVYAVYIYLPKPSSSDIDILGVFSEKTKADLVCAAAEENMKVNTDCGGHYVYVSECSINELAGYNPNIDMDRVARALYDPDSEKSL